jgi:oligopeptide transport system permease protein
MAQATQTLSKSQVGKHPALVEQSKSQWQLAWSRLRKNKGAVVGMFVILLFVIMALFAPAIAPHNPIEQRTTDFQYTPPFWQSQSPSGKSFNPQFILGTDSLGRDVFSRIVYGSRTSFVVSIIPLSIIMIIGTLIGFTAGMMGGKIDNILMRITDIFYALPDTLFIVLIFVTVGNSALGQAGNGVVMFALAIGVLFWVGLARLTRGQALTLKGREFVEASRSLGLNQWQLMWKHIFPNSLSVIIIWAAYAIPTFVLIEVTLGFLGIGLRPSIDPRDIFITSWGRLLLDGRADIQSQPGFLLSTVFFIALYVTSCRFLADGLRDALDPRQGK